MTAEKLAAAGLRVRNLEWHHLGDTPVRYIGHPADPNGENYIVRLVADDPDVWACGLDGEGWIDRVDTLEDAKAAAQADFEARVLAALEEAH